MRLTEHEKKWIQDRHFQQRIVFDKYSDKVKFYQDTLCPSCIQWKDRQDEKTCRMYLIPVTTTGDQCPYFVKALCSNMDEQGEI